MDRVQLRYPAVLGLLFTAGAFLVAMATTSAWQMFVGSVLFGAGAGTMMITQSTMWPVYFGPGITHIKLPGSKQRTILDESHRSISHGCRQPSNQAHKTISRRGELAAPGSGGGFHHVCTPFKLLRARTSPLVASLHL